MDEPAAGDAGAQRRRYASGRPQNDSPYKNELPELSNKYYADESQRERGQAAKDYSARPDSVDQPAAHWCEKPQQEQIQTGGAGNCRSTPAELCFQRMDQHRR